MSGFLMSAPGLVAVAGLIALVFLGLRQKRTALVLSDPRLIMQIVVSLVVLGAALYVILSKQYETEAQKWASGVVGTVIGYWLRTP